VTAGPKIKICGVTLPEDAAHVGASGADYIGLNFWAKSKRHLSPDCGAVIANAARAAGAVQVVGVFVDASVEEIAAVAAEVGLDIIQLHGNEDAHEVASIVVATQRPVWRSIAVGTAADVEHLDAWPVDALLLDTPSAGKGGSGKSFDWSLAAAAVHANPRCHLMLAGGLDPSNVARAIREVSPWGVDVASGVETAPGVKDAAKITAFVAAVRGQSR
jgi:phosphoribosylanthranilate isomerase